MPGPPLPSEVSRYTPADRRRLEVTPGLTCIWQVSGRAELPFEDLVRLDLEYIERRSVWFDLTLIAQALAVPMARVVHWAQSQLPPMAEAELTDSAVFRILWIVRA